MYDCMYGREILHQSVELYIIGGLNREVHCTGSAMTGQEFKLTRGIDLDSMSFSATDIRLSDTPMAIRAVAILRYLTAPWRRCGVCLCLDCQVILSGTLCNITHIMPLCYHTQHNSYLESETRKG